MEHPAFAEAGAQKGLEIWRIENFEPVQIPDSSKGKFYNADSYIVLKTKEDRSRISYDLHFWLGSKTSQDKSGSAAIHTVTLDDKLGGRPVQHREVQGHESSAFLGYFKPAIRYLEGGTESGFNEVETNAGAEKRMFQVKGKQNIRVKEVDPSISSMNNGDCFILDVDHDIYVFIGPGSRHVERLKAISVANQIRDQDHNGRAQIEILDDASTDEDYDKFFEALGSGSRDDLTEESVDEDDQSFERTDEQTVSMYKISETDGELSATALSKPFKQEQLDEDGCYVLDTVTSGLYIWVGTKCDMIERQGIMKKAQKYMESKNYPSWLHVTRVPQGSESAAFKQYFTWKDHGAAQSRLLRAESDEDMYSSDPEVAKAKIKSVAKSGSARGFMPDGGKGHTTVYRVEDMELVEVADSEDRDRGEGHKFGQFYQGDAYVIKYEGSGEIVLYYWLGKDSTIEEKSAAAMQVVAMDNELGGSAVHVRVPQGEETKHFLKIFSGHLVTHLGGYDTGFKSLNQRDSYDDDGTRLYKIHGSEKDGDMRAEQVPEEANSLDHEDTFLLETPSQVYAWIGKESSDLEQESIAEFATAILGEEKEMVIVQEGEEPEEFWEALGGAPEEVKDSNVLKQRTRLRVGRDPHLLQLVVDFRNKVTLREVGGYSQQDLDSEDVYLMDSGEEIYAWIGSKATKRERNAIQTAVSQYLTTDPSERTAESTVVINIKQGHEPTIYKRMFDEWDSEMWDTQISYEDMKTKTREKNSK